MVSNNIGINLVSHYSNYFITVVLQTPMNKLNYKYERWIRVNTHIQSTSQSSYPLYPLFLSKPMKPTASQKIPNHKNTNPSNYAETVFPSHDIDSFYEKSPTRACALSFRSIDIEGHVCQCTCVARVFFVRWMLERCRDAAYLQASRCLLLYQPNLLRNPRASVATLQLVDQSEHNASSLLARFANSRPRSI